MASRPVIHPPLVHFPIAFWSLATLSGWVARFSDLIPANFSFFLLIAGMITALPAVFSGFIEVGQIREETVAMKVAYAHIAAMGIASVLYLVSLLLRLSEPTATPGLLSLGLSALGFVSLIAGGAMGGRLVYTYGVGRRRSSKRKRGGAMRSPKEASSPGRREQ